MINRAREQKTDPDSFGVNVMGGQTLVKDLPTRAFTFPSPLIDPTFGSGGSVVTSTSDSAELILPRADGSFVVVGDANFFGFKANGSGLRRRFGVNGQAVGGLLCRSGVWSNNGGAAEDGKIVAVSFEFIKQPVPVIHPL